MASNPLHSLESSWLRGKPAVCRGFSGSSKWPWLHFHVFVGPCTWTPTAYRVTVSHGETRVVKAVKGLMFRGGIATSSRSDATSWAKQGSAGASIGMVMV